MASDNPGRRTTPHEGDLADIVAVVREARRQADWVIVTSHTHESAGSREVPAEFLETFARAVVDAGADIFVGHGPHVMRGIEIYQGKPIFYSLSNFIFQNETVRFLPGDMYARYGVSTDGHPGDIQDARIEQSSTGGFPGLQDYWESVVAVPLFNDGQLAEIRLYPITLGFETPRPQRGRPKLADAQAGQRIIESIKKLSEPYGVSVRYLRDENVGIIRRR